MGHQLYMDALTMERPDAWQDRAACAGTDPTIFEIIDDDHAAGVGLLVNDRIKLTNENFAKAEEICLSCPVMDECWEDADTEDRQWVYRAGRYPSRFSGKTRGRPVGAVTGAIKGVRCRVGHSLPPGHTGRCPDCLENRKARSRYAKAEARQRKKQEELDRELAEAVD